VKTVGRIIVIPFSRTPWIGIWNMGREDKKKTLTLALSRGERG